MQLLQCKISTAQLQASAASCIVYLFGKAKSLDMLDVAQQTTHAREETMKSAW